MTHPTKKLPDYARLVLRDFTIIENLMTFNSIVFSGDDDDGDAVLVSLDNQDWILNINQDPVRGGTLAHVLIV